jgi:hypothetical protein
MIRTLIRHFEVAALATAVLTMCAAMVVIRVWCSEGGV